MSRNLLHSLSHVTCEPHYKNPSPHLRKNRGMEISTCTVFIYSSWFCEYDADPGLAFCLIADADPCPYVDPDFHLSCVYLLGHFCLIFDLFSLFLYHGDFLRLNIFKNLKNGNSSYDKKTVNFYTFSGSAFWMLDRIQQLKFYLFFFQCCGSGTKISFWPLDPYPGSGIGLFRDPG
jgi:hypothetical protein